MSRPLQQDAQRVKAQPTQLSETGKAAAAKIANEPQDQCVYIIRGHLEDGDYLCAVEHNEWATCPLHFIWTKDRDKAQVFTEKQQDAIAPHIVTGYSGTGRIQIQ